MQTLSTPMCIESRTCSGQAPPPTSSHGLQLYSGTHMSGRAEEATRAATLANRRDERDRSDRKQDRSGRKQNRSGRKQKRTQRTQPSGAANRAAKRKREDATPAIVAISANVEGTAASSSIAISTAVSSAAVPFGTVSSAAVSSAAVSSAANSLALPPTAAEATAASLTAASSTTESSAASLHPNANANPNPNPAPSPVHSCM